MKSIFTILTMGMGLMALMAITSEAEIDCNVYPDPVNVSVCCSGPEFFTAEITEKCRKYDADFLTNDPSSHSPCFVSCMFNETGIFDKEQKLHEASLHDYLTLIFKDEFIAAIPILEELFKTCVTKADEMHSDWLAYRKEKMATDTDFAHRMKRLQCPTRPMFLMGCIFIKTFPNCPSKVGNESEHCHTLRNFIRDCEPNVLKWYDSIYFSGAVENKV